jgi:hypothetical protein
MKQCSTTKFLLGMPKKLQIMKQIVVLNLTESEPSGSEITFFFSTTETDRCSRENG